MPLVSRKNSIQPPRVYYGILLILSSFPLDAANLCHGGSRLSAGQETGAVPDADGRRYPSSVWGEPVRWRVSWRENPERTPQPQRRSSGSLPDVRLLRGLHKRNTREQRETLRPSQRRETMLFPLIPWDGSLRRTGILRFLFQRMQPDHMRYCRWQEDQQSSRKTNAQRYDCSDQNNYNPCKG